MRPDVRLYEHQQSRHGHRGHGAMLIAARAAWRASRIPGQILGLPMVELCEEDTVLVLVRQWNSIQKANT